MYIIYMCFENGNVLFFQLQLELERRERYHFHRLQIQLRKCPYILIYMYFVVVCLECSLFNIISLILLSKL